MSKKIDRATHGPSWSEIILGIVLSLGLGLVLGAAVMMLNPVVAAKEMPKEPDPRAIYYIEGGRDASKARQAPAKRAAFAKGQTVSVTEDELNTLVAPAPAPAAKAGEAPPAPPPASTLATGTPNFRIHDGSLQIGVPVTLNVAGVSQKLTVLAQGKFAKQGDRFVFDPESMYVGSCPVHRLPFVAGYVRSQFIDAQPIPEDLAAAWPKLANVAMEGKTLTLTMP